MDYPAASKIRIISDLFLVTLFLLAIGSPLAANLFGVEAKISLDENRTLAPKPTLRPDLASVMRFPKEYGTYFNDHFGFRQNMVMWHNYIKYRIFGASPSSSIVVGNDGWLFFNENDSIEDFRQTKKLDDRTLDQWARVLTARNIWLRSKGIRYIVVFVPNKENIYPEFVPAKYNRIGNTSRLTQLMNRIRSDTDVRVLNLEHGLSEKKDVGFLYYRTDSHWNQLGAFIGCDLLMKELESWFPVERSTFSDYTVATQSFTSNDLARIMMTGTKSNDPGVILYPKKDRTAMRVELARNCGTSLTTVGLLQW